MSHSLEPWTVSKFDTTRVEGDRCGFSGEKSTVAQCQNPDDARRIAACVNILRGIPTKELERHLAADAATNHNNWPLLCLAKDYCERQGYEVTDPFDE